MKGWALVFPPFSLLPGQQAANVLRRLRCSWFFFGFNRSQRSDHGLICFFTAWPYFSHQQRECPFKLPPYLNFWWNLHHMPLKGMNRLAGMLLFSSPLSVQVVWSGPSPDGGKLSNPETVLCSQNCLTGDNEGLWFFFFFFEQRSHPERGGDRDLTKDVLTRPLLPNQLPEVEIGSYGASKERPSTSNHLELDVCLSAFSDSLSLLSPVGLEEFYFTLNYHCVYHTV